MNKAAGPGKHSKPDDGGTSVPRNSEVARNGPPQNRGGSG